MTGLSKDLILMECYCDAKNVVEGLDSNVPPSATTPYRNEFALIKQFKDEKKVHTLLHVSGEEQLADSLTKMGASEVDLVDTLNRGKFFN